MTTGSELIHSSPEKYLLQSGRDRYCPAIPTAAQYCESDSFGRRRIARQVQEVWLAEYLKNALPGRLCERTAVGEFGIAWIDGRQNLDTQRIRKRQLLIGRQHIPCPTNCDRYDRQFAAYGSDKRAWPETANATFFAKGAFREEP